MIIIKKEKYLYILKKIVAPYYLTVCKHKCHFNIYVKHKLKIFDIIIHILFTVLSFKRFTLQWRSTFAPIWTVMLLCVDVSSKYGATLSSSVVGELLVVGSHKT